MTDRDWMEIAQNADGIYDQWEQEEAVQRITDDSLLFELARDTIREDDLEAEAARIAAKRIKDPAMLAKLAAGAMEYEVSRIAVSRLEDDALLKQVLAEAETKQDRWISPLDERGGETKWVEEIQLLAAKKMRDRRHLIDWLCKDRRHACYSNGYPIPTDIGRVKQQVIGLLEETPEVLAQYAEQETSLRALFVIAKHAKGIPVLACLKRKLETNAYEADAGAAWNDSVRESLREEIMNRWNTASRNEEIWTAFSALPVPARNKAERRVFGYEVSGRSSGWETAELTVDQEHHSCEISDIGPSAREFESFVYRLKDQDYGTFSWYCEPGTHTWFLSRRDPWLYAEIPGFKTGMFFAAESFRSAVLRDYEAEPGE